MENLTTAAGLRPRDPFLVTVARARAARIIANVSGAPEPKRLKPYSSLHAQICDATYLCPYRPYILVRHILRACRAPKIAQILDRDVRPTTKSLPISICWLRSVQILATPDVGPRNCPSSSPCSCPRWRRASWYTWDILELRPTETEDSPELSFLRL